MHLASTLRSFPLCQAIFHQHLSMHEAHLLCPFFPNYSDFILCHRALVTRLLSQGYKGNCLCNTFSNSMEGTLIELDNTKKCLPNVCRLSVKMIFSFDGFGDGKIDQIS